MGYTQTFPRRTALGKTTAVDGSANDASIAFFFLIVFTIILYGRPADLFRVVTTIPLAAITAGFAGIAYIAARLQGKVPFVWTTEIKLVFGLTLLFIAGVPFAFWSANSLNELTNTWFKTMVIFFLITQVVFTTDRVRKLLWVIILCELVVATHSSLFGTERAGRVQGTTRGFLSGNYLGIAVATTLPFMAAFVVSSRSFLKTMTVLASFAASMWLVVLTASRGSLVAVLFSLGLVWITILRENAKARMLGMVLAIAMVAALALAPGAFWARIGTLWDEDSYASSDASRSAGQSEYQRRALLLRSITYTLERPLFGLGIGNFEIKSGSTTGRSGEWKGTHNTYTQVSAEAGIPAFILFVSLLIISVRNSKRISKWCAGRPGTEELSLLTRANRVSIYAFMLSALFAHLAYEYHFYYLAGIGVALQSAHMRMVKQVGDDKPLESNGAAGNGGRKRFRNGKLG